MAPRASLRKNQLTVAAEARTVTGSSLTAFSATFTSHSSRVDDAHNSKERAVVY